MARFVTAAALSTLISLSCYTTTSVAFRLPTTFITTRRRELSVTTRTTTTGHHVASTTGYDFPNDAKDISGSGGGSSTSDSLTATVISLSAEYLESLSGAVDDSDDEIEQEIARRRRKVRERSGTYQVLLPILAEEGSSPKPWGFSLCQVESGARLSETELNVDTLQYITRLSTPVTTTTALQVMDSATMAGKLDKDFKGVMVSSVARGGVAWNAGIRPGDILTATSATMGDALWPKRTLDGVKSAMMSRRIMAGSMAFEFKRISEVVNNQFELTLSRPIGIEIEETSDGYVQVTGFTNNAPKLVKYAIQVGDRVVAVDSSIGDRMWPVSTVEGVISACTSRLPGQAVTIRFERPTKNMLDASSQQTRPITAMAYVSDGSLTDSATIASEQKTLLSRCRDVLRRYTADEQQKERVQFSNKYAVPALVADKVLDALASENASVDSITLSMIMNAYLSCRMPDGAIRAFEAAVGINANGSPLEPLCMVEGKDGCRLTANPAALDLFTGSSLLQAHALKGDMDSMQRVLAALEGRSGVVIKGVESAAWPGTGSTGSIAPDTTCYNIALSAATKNGATDGLQMALYLFDSMSEPKKPEAGRRPEKDLVSYNTMIGALAKAGRSKDAFTIFYSMKEAGVKPDKFTYTSLVDACENDVDVQELLYDMKEQGVEPDVVTYNTIIKFLCEQYQWFEAKKLVTEMESRGIAPDSMTYGLLMNGLLMAGKPSACLVLFESACADGRSVALTENVNLYTTAIVAAAALRDHERAIELVSRMSGLGVKPNLKTLTALMGACLASDKFDLAATIYRKIDNPDGYAMSQGIRAFCGTGEFQAAIGILTSQKRGKHAISGKQLMLAYKNLIDAALARRDYETARFAYNDLVRNGFIPPKSLLHAIIDTLELLPNKKKMLLKEEDTDKFDFLLFVLDGLRRRKLSCDSKFYAAVLTCGARIGGLRKKIASLLVESRTVHSGLDGKEGVLLTEKEADVRMVEGWEDLVQNYDAYKTEFGTLLPLPKLLIQMDSRDVRLVLAAETAVSYAVRRRPSS